MPSSQPLPQWPARIAATVAALRVATAATRDPLRAELWQLLHAALFAALRAQAGRVVAVTREDLEDLASQKSLELLLQAEDSRWDIGGRTPDEIAGYVARVGRHALVDLVRQRGRECPGPEDTEAWEVVFADRIEEASASPGPEDRLATIEFARALRVCVEALSPRARHAWYRRAFLERPSREIAVTLGLSPAHVDVVVQRARGALRECMRRKGHRGDGLRPGAFVELWRHFSDAMEPEGAQEPATQYGTRIVTPLVAESTEGGRP